MHFYFLGLFELDLPLKKMCNKYKMLMLYNLDNL